MYKLTWASFMLLKYCAQQKDHCIIYMSMDRIMWNFKSALVPIFTMIVFKFRRKYFHVFCSPGIQWNIWLLEVQSLYSLQIKNRNEHDHRSCKENPEKKSLFTTAYAPVIWNPIWFAFASQLRRSLSLLRNYLAAIRNNIYCNRQDEDVIFHIFSIMKTT